MELPDWIEQLLLGGIGSALVAVGLFKFFVQNWIKHQFSKILNRQSTEISFHANKRMSLHNKEYEVFPEVWKRLNILVNANICNYQSIFKIPNFKKMTQEKISDWADDKNLSRSEKEFLLESDDKSESYIRIIKGRDLYEARKAFFEFRSYLGANREFF